MTIRLSARARAHVDRAKRHGADYEEFEPEEIFERDGYLCMANAAGKRCRCGLRANKHAEFPALDFPTLGHEISVADGGRHLRTTTFCQRWECNQRQNHVTDIPTRAKNTRRRQREEEHQARLIGLAPTPEAIPGPSPRKMQSRGFKGSRAFNGARKWKSRHEEKR